MNYDNRLRRLEERMPTGVSPCLTVEFIDTTRGLVSAYDPLTGEWLRRGDGEEEDSFRARVAPHDR